MSIKAENLVKVSRTQNERMYCNYHASFRQKFHHPHAVQKCIGLLGQDMLSLDIMLNATNTVQCIDCMTLCYVIFTFLTYFSCMACVLTFINKRIWWWWWWWWWI